jgi:hypothetical protein
MQYTYDIIASDLIDFTPSLHDESIIRSNNSHNINTLCLELLQFLNVRRKVVCLTAGGECA